MKNLNYKYLSIISLVLFVPSIASACGDSQPGDPFYILLPLAILLFIYINRKYFVLIFKNKRIMLITIIPLLIIGIVVANKFIEENNQLEIDNRNVIKCDLENYNIIKEQSAMGISRSEIDTRPCGVTNDIRMYAMRSIDFFMELTFFYSIILILYGVYEKKKNKEVGKKIIRFSISLILLLIFIYISIIMMTTVLLC